MSGEIDTGYCTANARRRLLKVLAGAALAAPLTVATQAQAWELNRNKIIANSRATSGRNGAGKGGGTHGQGSGSGGTSGSDTTGSIGRQCLLAGTRILTTRGAVAIENLSIGDVLETVDGLHKPIAWTAQSTIEREAGGPWKRSDWLVRIVAGALGEGLPTRDVWITPSHAIYLNGYLIPAELLVNGRNVRLEEPRTDRYVVHHVGLSDHRVMFAEGIPVETLLDPTRFRDLGNRDVAPRAAEGTVPLGLEYASRLAYNGRRQEIVGLLRASLYPIVDIRDPIHRICDTLSARPL